MLSEYRTPVGEGAARAYAPELTAGLEGVNLRDPRRLEALRGRVVRIALADGSVRRVPVAE